VLLATAAFEDGPTAGLRLHGETLLERLRGQLASLGVGLVHVITRPGALPQLPGAAIRHESADPAEDLRVVAGIARAGAGTLVIALADLVAHREALAGLLADPRLDTAILAAPPQNRPFATRIRVGRGRVVSAGSAYHRVHRADSRFLGALKVAPADRELLAATAERLAELIAAPPPDWERTLAYKGAAWRRVLARRADGALSPADEAELRRRRAGDPTRRRRNFETNLRMLRPQRQYFEALRAAAPSRVAIVEAGPRAEVVERVMDALRRLPAGRPDSLWLFDRAADWVRARVSARNPEG
jgi:hypothetical protein